MGLVGRSYIEIDGDLRPLQAKVREARKLADALNPRGGGGAGSSTSTASANAAAIAQQRLATEQARTAKTAAQAAVEDARLATEHQRTAKAAAAAEQAQLRLNQARSREGAGGGSGGERSAGAFSQFSASAINLAKGLIAVDAAQRGLSFIKAGADASDARRSFDALAVSAQTTGDVLLKSLQEAAQGSIRDADLIKSANTGILLTQGKLTKELPRLIEIARASAKATGQDVGFIFDSLTRGIARGSPMIIDNAGITLNAAQAFEVYAKSIGKSADQLTKSEQQQATLNAVLLAGGEIVNQIGVDANSASNNIDRATVAVGNLATAIAQKLAPFIGTAAGGLANLLNLGTTNPETGAAGDAVQAKLVGSAKSYEEYAARVKNANAQIFSAFGQKPGDDPAGDALARQLYGLKLLSPLQYQYAQALNASGASEQQAIARAKQLGDTAATLSDDMAIASAGNSEQASTFDRLGASMLKAASVNDTYRDQVRDLIAAYGSNEISAGELESKIQDLNSTSNQAFDIEQRRATQLNNLRDAQRAAAAATDGATLALTEQLQGQLEGQASGQRMAEIQASLASVAARVKAGFISSSEGAALLRQLYGDAIPNAERLLELQLQLGKTNKLVGSAAYSSQLPADAQKALDYANQQDVAARRRLEIYGSTAAKIARAEKDLAQARAVYGKDSAQALDAEEKIANLKKQQASGGAGGRGLSTYERTELQLIEDKQARLAEINRLLEQGNLSRTKRNQLEIEARKLSEEIADAEERRQDAALGAAAAAIENRQAQREEEQRLRFLDQIARGGSSQAAAAADEAALIRIRQEQRTRALNRQVAEAGGTVPALGTTPADAPQATGSPAGAAAAGAAPGGAAGSGGGQLIIQIDGLAFARAIDPYLDQIQSHEIRAVSTAGG